MINFLSKRTDMNKKKECLIYLRTSTLTNKEGDSSTRQKSSIMKWVKSNGYSVKGEYWDIESGSMNTMDRPEFMRMISDSEKNGIKVFVFENQSRLSRDIIVQESTFRLLSPKGYSLISSENPLFGSKNLPRFRPAMENTSISVTQPAQLLTR